MGYTIYIFKLSKNESQNKIEYNNKSENKEWKKYLNKFYVIFLKMKDYFNDFNMENGIDKIKNTIIYEVKKTVENFNLRDESFLSSNIVVFFSE